MSQIICKLCLFKTELPDEILVEESKLLQQIIDDLFHKMVSMTKLELDGVCSPCRGKLKSFHEYFTFVLENQKTYEMFEPVSMTDLSAKDCTEFISVLKVEESLEPTADLKSEVDDERNDLKSESESEPEKKQRKRTKSTEQRIRKPHRYMAALHKQQSDLIETLFDFRCDMCTCEPGSFRNVVNHYKRKHKKTRMWTCCGKEMSGCIELIEHVMEHQGDWKCDPCNLKVESGIELWKHRNKCHLEPSKIELQDPVDWLKLRMICDLCGEKFRTRGLIDRHMKDAHTRNFTCDLCGAGFYNRQASAKHRLKEHSSTPKVACPICNVMLRNTGHALRYHIKNLHKNRSMVCPICGKLCENDSRYRMHMSRNHQPPKYKCQYCDKRFKIKYHLDDHEAIHTGISRYFCEFCNAHFKSQGNFTAHKRKLHPLEHKQQQLEREAKRYQM